jgi:hypothetical protein
VPTVANSKVYVGTKGVPGSKPPLTGTVFAFAGNSSNNAKNIPLTNNPNVKLTPGAFVGGAGGLVTQTVTVTNTSTTTPLFTTPLSLVLDGLSLNATLLSASGATTYQASPLDQHLASPYQHFALSGPLAAGASVSLTLQFLNSSNTLPITYAGQGQPGNPRLLDGPGFR